VIGRYQQFHDAVAAVVRYAAAARVAPNIRRTILKKKQPNWYSSLRVGITDRCAYPSTFAAPSDVAFGSDGTDRSDDSGRSRRSVGAGRSDVTRWTGRPWRTGGASGSGRTGPAVVTCRTGRSRRSGRSLASDRSGQSGQSGQSGPAGRTGRSRHGLFD